jgi:hypothetical protein
VSVGLKLLGMNSFEMLQLQIVHSCVQYVVFESGAIPFVPISLNSHGSLMLQ